MQQENGTIWHLCRYAICQLLSTGGSWWHHQMETFSTLLALCVGNSLVTGEFPAQRPVMWSFDISFDLRLNKRLSKQSWDWWSETPSPPFWRHCHANDRWWIPMDFSFHDWKMFMIQWQAVVSVMSWCDTVLYSITINTLPIYWCKLVDLIMDNIQWYCQIPIRSAPQECMIHSLQWRHNGPYGISNHQPHDCLLNSLFWCRSKEHQSTAPLAFVWGIHWWPVNSLHKGPATRNMFPFDDIIMWTTM